eukprot:COSAG01_NODE_51492_length_354_cov_1.011765_1_plen_24_part_10
MTCPILIIAPTHLLGSHTLNGVSV